MAACESCAPCESSTVGRGAGASKRCGCYCTGVGACGQRCFNWRCFRQFRVHLELLKAEVLHVDVLQVEVQQVNFFHYRYP